MNYRHDFHVDVFKHIFLSRVLHRLGAKPSTIRYIETHAGSGIHCLSGREAEKTSE
jgi:23S rRNA (adenine2030-N6)-methyltransferase